MANGQNPPQVVTTVIAPPEKSEESTPISDNQTNQAIEYGKMIESNRVAQEKISLLEAKLSSMESQGQENTARYQALSSQLDRLTAALAQAEAEEEEEDREEVEEVTPPEPEPEKPVEPPKKKKNAFWKVVLGG